MEEPCECVGALAPWERRAPAEERAGGFGPRRGEGGLELPNRGALEAHIGFPPAPAAEPISKPPVVDAEPAGPSDKPIDDNPPDVRAILCEVERREAKGTKRHDDCASFLKCGLVLGWHVLKSEGIIEQEDPDTRPRTFLEDVSERVGYSACLAEVQLQCDRLTGRPQVSPEPRERLVAIQQHFDPVTR